MEDYSEKRKYYRYDYNSPVFLRTYDSQENYYKGSLRNYGGGGLYLQSDENLDVGQEVYVKIANYSQGSEGPEKYRNYSGYVKWSNDLGTSSPGGQYGYGVEYAEPVYY